MAENLFDLQAKITLDTKGYEQGVENVEKSGVKLGDKLKTAFKVGAAAIGTVVAATTALTAAMVKGVSSVGQYGDSIDKMSQKMGMSAKSFQEWDFVLQHSGSSIESMQAGMKTLATAAETGNKAFDKLGLTQDKIAGMSQEELFGETIKALQNVESETERTYLASQLLGRGAVELGALLNTSAEEVEEMKKRVHELGGVMSDEAVKASAKFQDSLQDLKTAFTGLKNNLFGQFMPNFTAVMDGITEILSGNTEEGVEIISSGISEMLNKITEKLPIFFEVGIKIVENIFNSIDFDELLNIGSDIIFKIANGAIEKLPEIVSLAVNLATSFINKLSEQLTTLIPVVIDALLSVIESLTSPETITAIFDAALKLIVNLAIGLIKAIPVLLERLPVIVMNISMGLLNCIPVLIEAGIQLIFGLIEGLGSGESTTALMRGGIEAVGSFIKGILNYSKQMINIGKTIIGKVKEGVMAFLDDPVQWGKDLIDNFVKGIKEKVKSVIDTVKNVGQTIKDFLGFSEPKKGALSNFHTYAPDMMKLFAKGIEDNEKLVLDQVKDLSSSITESINITSPDASYPKSSGLYDRSRNIIENVTINVDGAKYNDEKALAETIAQELQRMVERRGAVYA